MTDAKAKLNAKLDEIRAAWGAAKEAEAVCYHPVNGWYIDDEDDETVIYWRKLVGEVKTLKRASAKS